MLCNKNLLWSNVENISLWNFRLHIRTLKALRSPVVKKDFARSGTELSPKPLCLLFFFFPSFLSSSLHPSLFILFSFSLPLLFFPSFPPSPFFLLSLPPSFFPSVLPLLSSAYPVSQNTYKLFFVGGGRLSKEH